VDENRIIDILAKAAAIVDAADLPDDLRAPGYTAAVGLLASAHPADAAAAGQTPIQLASGRSAPPSGLLDRIAAGLAIDSREIRNLYDEADGAPVLIVKSSGLPSSKAAGSHDVALLVMAARQLGGVDDYTDAGVLRDAAKHYGKFDQANFGKHMTALDNLILTTGKGSSTKRKLTQPGIEAAAELAKEYLAEGGS